MKIKQILLKTKGCVLEEFDSLKKDLFLKYIPATLPEDLASLFTEFRRVVIYDDANQIPANGNSWALYPSFFTNMPTFADQLYPEVARESYMQEYYECFYTLGNNANDGAHIIGLSLHPDSLGMVFEFFCDSFGPPVGMRKIANSFTEWVERTIAAGPNGEVYWARADFVDLGPAIPNDPYYEPLN